MKEILQNSKRKMMSILLFFLTAPMMLFAQQTNPSTVVSLEVENPLNIKSLQEVIEALLNGLVTVGIPVLVLAVVWAGFSYVTAQGKPEAISKVHKMLGWTLVGGIVLLGAKVIAEIIRHTAEQI